MPLVLSLVIADSRGASLFGDNVSERRTWLFSNRGYNVVMKATHAIAVSALVFACGCGDKSTKTSSSATNSTSSSPLTAPVDYLGALGKAQQTAGKTADTASINQAIQMFQVDKGRYPSDLGELVREGYMPRLPKPPYGMKFLYDSNVGQIKVVNQ